MEPQDYLRISTMQIHYFIEVANCSSFSSAAQHLYTTQSTLSKTISALEKTLDVQLFIRSHKRLILTDAGKHLYHRWENILRDIENSVHECRILQGGYTNQLFVGVLDSFNSEKTLSPFVRHFLVSHPDINLAISATPAQEIRKQLIAGNMDIAFTVLYDIEQLETEEFETIVLDTCPHSVCMLPSCPLAEHEFLEVSELKSYDFVAISPLYTPSYVGAIIELCKNAGFMPHFARYTANALSLPYNLISGREVFLCDRHYREYQNPAANYLQFRPLTHTTSGLIAAWKKSNTKKCLADFVTSLRSQTDTE